VTHGAARCAALVIAALVFTTRASAAPTGEGEGVVPAEAVLLVYEPRPPPGCPTAAEFEAEVAKLTAKARFTQVRPARLVRIELSSRGREVAGRLVTGEGRDQSSRQLRGKTCPEVASALAIALALTIDPEALLGPGEPDAPPSPPPASAPRPAPPRPPPPEPAKEQSPPSRLRVGLGAGLPLESAWAPRMRPGGKVLAVGAYGERWRVTLGLTRFFTRTVDDVAFGAWVLDAALSYNVALLGVVRPFASVGYELGVVRASGSGLPTAVDAERPWQAASVGLGLRFEAGRFFVQLVGSLLVPVSRQRYLVSDPFGKVRTLYEVPSLGLKQETSLGLFL
jgi:hypothetical protein